jgi:hypothetical protein
MAALEQAPCHERNAAGPMQIGRDEAAAGLEVGEQWHAAADAIEVVDLERHARFTRDREQVQHGVRRSAGRGDGRDAVLDGLAGEDLPRTEVTPQQVDRQGPGGPGDRGFVRTAGRHAGAAEGRDAEALADGRHRVGGELSAARARAGTGLPFERGQVLRREAAGGMGADRLEHVLNRHVLVVPAAGRDGAPVQDQARHVEARERHHAGGDGLVTADQHDHRVEQVAARHQLDRIRDHFTAHERGAHPFAAHRDAVGDRDGVELERRGAGRAQARLDVRRQLAEVVVAGTDLDPGIRDADERTRQIVIGEAGGTEHRAGRGPARPVGQRGAPPLQRMRGHGRSSAARAATEWAW